MMTELEERAGVQLTDEDRPQNSKLYRSRQRKLRQLKAAHEEHAVFMESFERFLKVLKEVNASGDDIDDVISKQELQTVLSNASKVCKDNENDVDDDIDDDGVDYEVHDAAASEKVFSADDREILFGVDADLDHIFNDLDVDGDGSITFEELFKFIERSGVDIETKHQGYSRREVKSVGQFFEGIQESLMTNIKHLFLEPEDVYRTVGINTDYVDTTDFDLEQCDKEFLLMQGRRATISYLKHYVYKNNPPRRVVTSCPQSECALPSSHGSETGVVEPITVNSYQTDSQHSTCKADADLRRLDNPGYIKDEDLTEQTAK